LRTFNIHVVHYFMVDVYNTLIYGMVSYLGDASLQRGDNKRGYELNHVYSQTRIVPKKLECSCTEKHTCDYEEMLIVCFATNDSKWIQH
jgi:hypothetical protein